jgi:protein SCO1
MTKLILLLSCFTTFAIAQPVWAHGNHGHAMARPKPIVNESIFNLQSQWTNQTNDKVTLSRFSGHPSVLAMIYTSCKDACPMIVSDMKKIEKSLPHEKARQVQFILVSFDSETDTPKRLLEYAQAHALDLERWTLLTGSQDSVREISAILDVKFKKIGLGDFEHSNVITILNSNGEIKYQQVGLNQDPKNAVDTLEKL